MMDASFLILHAQDGDAYIVTDNYTDADKLLNHGGLQQFLALGRFKVIPEWLRKLS